MTVLIKRNHRLCISERSSYTDESLEVMPSNTHLYETVFSKYYYNINCNKFNYIQFPFRN